MLILQRKNRSKSIPMKRFSLFFITILLLITGCAEPASIEHPLDGDSMERPAYLQIDQEQAKRMMQQDDGHVIVDVRRQDEYDAGHIPGAILIPNESIGTEPPKELPDFNQIILVYCRSGNRSKQAAEKLGQMGYSRVYEFGGIIDWTGEIITKSVEETPADPNDYSGYYENGSYDVVRIEKSEDGYTMSVDLYRLTSLMEGTVSASEEGVVFYTVDAAGSPMTVSFYRDGEKYALRGFINRGFLFGPWLPIYGIGVFIILGFFALLKIKKPLLVFVVGAAIATIAELTASYIIDMTIGVPMWDYTNEFLNFDSRIALVPSLMFGLLIWVAVCLVQPLIVKVQGKIRDAKAHNVIFIIIVFLFLLDLVSRIWLGSNCVG